MVTLFDVTLDLARQCRTVKRYKISQVDTVNNGFTSASMQNLSSEYVGGTVWVMSGENKGHFAKITRSVNQAVYIDTTWEDPLEVGDVVMICPWIDFNLDELIDAINSVLYNYPILAMDDTLTWSSTQMVYELNDGVSDVRRVQIENTNEDGTYTISHCWQEDKDGMLRFHTAQGLYSEGGTMQIYYRTTHEEVYDDIDEIDPIVDLTFLRNMAFLWLWRNVLVTQHKDNPIAADMYNEAKMYEQQHQKYNLPERNIMIRDFFTR